MPTRRARLIGLLCFTIYPNFNFRQRPDVQDPGRLRLRWWISHEGVLRYKYFSSNKRLRDIHGNHYTMRRFTSYSRMGQPPGRFRRRSARPKTHTTLLDVLAYRRESVPYPPASKAAPAPGGESALSALTSIPELKRPHRVGRNDVPMIAGARKAQRSPPFGRQESEVST